MTDAMDSFVRGPLSAFRDSLARCKANGGYTVYESEILEMLDRALNQVPTPGE